MTRPRDLTAEQQHLHAKLKHHTEMLDFWINETKLRAHNRDVRKMAEAAQSADRHLFAFDVLKRLTADADEQAAPEAP